MKCGMIGIAKIQKAENNSSSVQEIDKETQKEVK